MFVGVWGGPGRVHQGALPPPPHPFFPCGIPCSPAVREFAIACMAHAIASHPRDLGSGWRVVIEALAAAASDSSTGGCAVALMCTVCECEG
jgi:hypothetical protein